jgi:release factor glutamine methyltransferase
MSTEGREVPRRYEQPGGLTIGEACMQASSYLAAHGVEEPRANAERLLLHVLRLDKAALLRDWREPWPSAGQEGTAEWVRLLERKAAGEPVQYLIGEQWFYGLPFAVTPAVLIPRPETELLVEAVLEAADRLWPYARAAEGRADAAVPTVVDVGTGSGAIAVTLASQRPRWRVAASDLSADALETARGNAARHGVAARLRFAQGDLLAPFARADSTAAAYGGSGTLADAADEAFAPGGLAGLRIDVLVSNPPYIPASDIAGLQREVRDHEPRLALDGGADGLDPYRRMVEQLPSLAAIPRIVAFELGQGQAQEVARLLREAGHWPDIRIVSDYAGIERHVIAVAQ